MRQEGLSDAYIRSSDIVLILLINNIFICV
jgi:hypothetical protein